MKLYFAGVGTLPERLKEMGVVNKLYSYANEQSYIKRWGSKGLILDSGAFTAWSQGITIDIDEFIKFVDNEMPQDVIQLDVIGDEDATWENWKYLDSRILTMPVIHYKASVEHIKRVMDSSEYICLGALVPLAKKKKLLTEWLDYIYTFKRIRDIKVHCLGLMTQEVLLRYPFYSADSSSAFSVVRYPIDDILWRYRQKTWKNADLCRYGIDIQLKLEKTVTEIWNKRLANA